MIPLIVFHRPPLNVPAPKVKGKNKKGYKKSANASSRHLPGCIASAAHLTASRVSVKKYFFLERNGCFSIFCYGSVHTNPKL